MRQTHLITWKQKGYAGNYYLAKQFHTIKFMCFCILISYCFYFFRRSNHLTRNTSSHALFAQFFKGEREYICFKNVSEYEIKQNLTWRELFAVQFALQSFAPKISNKSVCWETENYVASLTVTSESNNTSSPDLLGTKSHKTFKNNQKSKHSRGTLHETQLHYNLF